MQFKKVNKCFGIEFIYRNLSNFITAVTAQYFMLMEFLTLEPPRSKLIFLNNFLNRCKKLIYFIPLCPFNGEASLPKYVN